MAPIDIMTSATANPVGTINPKEVAFWVIADTRFDLPRAQDAEHLLSRGMQSRFPLSGELSNQQIKRGCPAEAAFVRPRRRPGIPRVREAREGRPDLAS